MILDKFKEFIEKGTLRNIIVGCVNHFLLSQFDNLPQNVKVLGEHRIKICEDCIVREKSYCSSEKISRAVTDYNYGTEIRIKGREYHGCGCYLYCKTLVENECCPLGKWLPV
jgi:hypothetical protein